MKSFALAIALLATTNAIVTSPVEARKVGRNAQLLERVAIEDLIATYLYRLDHGEAVTLAELFTEDGVLDVAATGPLTGKQAIRAYYARRSTTRTTRHVSTNLHIIFDDATHVRAVHTLTYYAAEGMPPLPSMAPAGVADYAETLVKGADGKWRFKHRQPTPVFGFGGTPPTTK
jgi:uncharacterized protein (TIGR02246 family)